MDYDPLLAKLIGYGTDRDQAIGRLTRASNEYFVGGIKTNISLFRRILSNPDFRAAKMDTGFLDRLLKQQDEKQSPEGPGGNRSGSHGRWNVCRTWSDEWAERELGEEAPPSNWTKAAKREALALSAPDQRSRMIYDITIDGKSYRLELDRVDGRWNVASTVARSKSTQCWYVRMCFRCASAIARTK